MIEDFSWGYSQSQLKDLGAQHTAREIAQQPQLWLDTYHLLLQQQDKIQHFLNGIYDQDKLRIILTGAGTSAYIGNILQGSFQQQLSHPVFAVATTDLVSHPHLYLFSSTPTLLISFARSGNSPESLAAIDLADQFCKSCHHLLITCNAGGQLALESKNINNRLLFILPPEAEDKSLAMTGSFTAMLLTGMLLPRLHELNKLGQQIQILAQHGMWILSNYSAQLREIAKLNFQRAVFLGSGPLLGTARECQLKLQELTDGKVICTYESFLGFRHGPKAVIDTNTLLVYLFTNNVYAHQYEIDLVNSIKKNEKGVYQLGIFKTKEDTCDLDTEIILSDKAFDLEEEFLAVCYVLPAQILGFYKSINLGLKPDLPSVSISRVVQGVKIYPLTNGNSIETTNHSHENAGCDRGRRTEPGHHHERDSGFPVHWKRNTC
ncbi:MAG TPA: SIS domain-containing protein [Cyclobacteriaceae bacterium]|nr:SIS domain-containing protein [Cyclobacteriaceae bacterium]